MIAINESPNSASHYLISVYLKPSLPNGPTRRYSSLSLRTNPPIIRPARSPHGCVYTHTHVIYTTVLINEGQPQRKSRINVCVPTGPGDSHGLYMCVFLITQSKNSLYRYEIQCRICRSSPAISYSERERDDRGRKKDRPRKFERA